MFDHLLAPSTTHNLSTRTVVAVGDVHFFAPRVMDVFGTDAIVYQIHGPLASAGGYIAYTVEDAFGLVQAFDEELARAREDAELNGE